MGVTCSARRLIALPQLAAWLITLGLGFEVSACPPGMDTGMDMPMSVTMEDRESVEGHPHPGSGMDCPFSGSMDDSGQGHCPLAVGGIGVCVGAGASTPGVSVAVIPAASVGELSQVFVARWRPSHAPEIQLPPPRT
jgi:hypothetical protein